MKGGVRYRLSPNEAARAIQEEKERRRKLRIVQVFLSAAYEVRGKVMFSLCLSVHLGGGGGEYPGQDHDRVPPPHPVPLAMTSSWHLAPHPFPPPRPGPGQSISSLALCLLPPHLGPLHGTPPPPPHPPPRQDIPRTGCGAGGTSLAFPRRRTFLFFFCFIM